MERLPPEQRAAVTEEAVKAGNEARRQVQEKDAWYIAEMEKAGMQNDRARGGAFPHPNGSAYKAIRGYVGEAAWSEWEKLVEASRKEMKELPARRAFGRTPSRWMCS